MEKIDKGHPMSQSTDFVAQNIETLKTLFPTIVKEGKIDIKELQALLGDEVETEEEYYRFTWAGKSMARREANKPSTATLRPDKESSKDWDTTQNIFIEGDNLEVLKLLQKSYVNKIKMIYIDPPYNTGKDFVYKDNYNDNLGNYLAVTGQIDEDGKRVSTNSESDGRYHSNWLNMMYPRLRLARNLLSKDGIIFISIDYNENQNLKKICDEIFGEENFISEFIWEKGKEGGNDSSVMRNHHESILAYCKDKNSPDIINLDEKDTSRHITSVPSKNLVKGIESNENEGELFQLINLSKQKDYTVEIPLIDGTKIEWPSYAPQSTIDKWIKIGKLYLNESGVPYVKSYLKDELQGQKPSNLLGQKYGTTKAGSIEIREIFGSREIFSYPKPSSLIGRFIQIGAKNDSVILDFFAGSGSTAHSVIQKNSEDGGNRKFICVQLPEQTDEKSEAFKAGYKTISEITKERIRRAGDKIISEQKEDLFSKEGYILDIGFRSFKLDSSNIRAWDGNPDALEANLFYAESNIKDNRTEEDVLYEILLKYGLDLTMPIEQKEIADKQVFNIGMGALFICLGENITTAIAEGIGNWKEEQKPATSKVIFKDTGFTDVEKTNSMQILKRFGIHEVNTI
jgi:adenine-specific DNA-methyltransferase